MDIQKLRQLKELFDEGALSEEEYNSLKAKALESSVEPTEKKPQKATRPKVKFGEMTVKAKGAFLLVDGKVRIYVDGNLLFTESVKNGFKVSFPIEYEVTEIEVDISEINSSKFLLEDLQPDFNYELTLKYGRMSGGYIQDSFEVVD